MSYSKSVINVTLHRKTAIKVLAQSQHAFTNCLLNKEIGLGMLGERFQISASGHGDADQSGADFF